MIVTLQEIKANPLINTFIEGGNAHLEAMGYTDHGPSHVGLVSSLSQELIARLGGDDREAELAAIAGYMHDIGNVINREGHSQAGAAMAIGILNNIGMPTVEVALVAGAIGNHDEGSGHPVSRVAAALILADKSHVHRNRVRNHDVATFDIHDRVNYAVNDSELLIDDQNRRLTMRLTIDNNICPVMEYFEIFLTRMLMCRRAAAYLGCEFELIINGAKLL
ncbi:MAG: HD domain-containing protein [Methylocystaceae bacterium]